MNTNIYVFQNYTIYSKCKFVFPQALCFSCRAWLFSLLRQHKAFIGFTSAEAARDMVLQQSQQNQSQRWSTKQLFTEQPPAGVTPCNTYITALLLHFCRMCEQADCGICRCIMQHHRESVYLQDKMMTFLIEYILFYVIWTTQNTHIVRLSLPIKTQSKNKRNGSQFVSKRSFLY